MPLSPGDRLGPCEIASELGEGAVGEGQREIETFGVMPAEGIPGIGASPRRSAP